MERLEKIMQNYREQLNDKDIKDISIFIQSIFDVDITKGKYARFLIEVFLNDKFLEEDLIGGLDSTVGQAISLFHKHKHKLPENMRSVYAFNQETGEALYQSPGDLWNNVKQFQGKLSGKELKKEEQEQIYRETEFIYKDKKTGFQIVSPLTKESAKWWGKGTRWCTSAEKNNRFEHYTKDAPLFILLVPDKQKLQLWKYDNRIQFMDENDNKISLDYIEQNWNILEPICKWLNDIRFIPEKYRDYNIYLEAVKQNGHALGYIPKELRDYSLCLEAVKNNGIALISVPKELRDYNIYLEAVKNNGEALSFVTKELRDYNIYLEAVKQYGEALISVPKELRDYNLCLEAVKQDGFALRYVPDEYINYDLCLEAVKNDEKALMYVPYQYRDYNLYLEIVKNNKMSLMYFPNEFMDYNLCLEAVKNNGEALSFVPKQFIDYNLCLEAIRNDGYSLYFVPEELRTLEICALAVQQNGEALQYVPENLKDYNLCLEAVKQYGTTLSSIPKNLKEEFKNYHNDIIKIPENFYQKVFFEIRNTFSEKDNSISI
jgi:hypothetical protein